MRSLLLLFLSCFLLSSAASAQIVAVGFKTEKAEKKYSKFLVDWRGQKVVVGEVKSGVTVEPGKGTSRQPDADCELFVVDPKKPEEDAYSIVDGEKVEASRKNRLRIQGRHIEFVTLLMRDQTLPGLSREYRIRVAQIEEFRELRDQFDKGSAAWQAQHIRLLDSLSRLRKWLESTAFPGVVKKIDRELKKEQNAVRDDAFRARAEAALNSIEQIETPAKLVAASEEISQGEHLFHAMQSQHLRIYYIDSVTHEQARAALELGEEIIEGWRTEFVDPYLDATFVDHIPDGLFQEFFFCPPELETFRAYLARAFGVQLREDFRPEIGGTRSVMGGMFHDFWRMDGLDIPGIVCHTLGHSLATLHYSGGSFDLGQDWITEGAGYYLSFEFLGRNNVTCKALDDPQGYVRRESERMEGDKTVEMGRRELYNTVALKEGRPIDQLALRILFEMGDGDLAKSWSFFDYIARKEGKQGQEWLRAAGKYCRNKKEFIAKWRDAAAEILGVDPRDAFKSVEERWRAYAEVDQDTSERGRKR